jgi:hypothetical protein
MKQITTPVAVVYNFAFVVPVYDYVDISRMEPAVDEECEGWCLFLWNGNTFVKQKKLYDDKGEAIGVGEAHHARMMIDLSIESSPHRYNTEVYEEQP